MSAKRRAAQSTSRLLITHSRLREYGVSSADLRRGVAPGAMDWPLRSEIRLRLAPLLTEAGFTVDAAITVRESRKPAGFELQPSAEGPLR